MRRLMKRSATAVRVLRPILPYIAPLLLAGLAVVVIRHGERTRLPDKAAAAARAAGYTDVRFEKVVRVGRQWAVACGTADGHKAVYAMDEILRVADRDPRAESRFSYYCM